MSADEIGPEPDPGDPRPPHRSLRHLDAATRPARHVVRSLRRIRFVRGSLLAIALLLILVVAYEIWSNRPRGRKRGAPAPTDQPKDAIQTLEKFEYTATDMGKLAYRILADKLVGVEGGLHTLQGIRSAEITLSDGRILRASADRGTFTTGAKDGGEGAGRGNGEDGSGAYAGGHAHVVLEGHVTVTSDAGERLESDRIDYFQAEGTLVSPGKCSFRLVPPPGSAGGIGPSEGTSGSATYELATRTIRMEGGVVVDMTGEGAPETHIVAARARIAADGTSAELDGDARVTQGEEYLEAPQIRMTRSADGDATRVLAGTGARGRLVSKVRAGPPAADPAAGAGAGAAPRPAAARAGAAPAAPPAGRATLVSARTIDSTGVASTGERRVTLEGDASLRDEAARGDVPGRTMTARRIVVHEPPRAAGGARAGTTRTLKAVDGVHVTFPPAAGETVPRVLTCATLDAVTAPDGSLATADADGNVKVESGPRRSVSARARMVGETHVELRGGRPVVEEPDRRVVADEIDLDTRPSQLTARGSVQTRFVPTGRGDGAPAASTAGAAVTGAAATTTRAGSGGSVAGATGALPFTPGVPVDVLSDAALLRQDARTAEFSGRVRARQADRALSAASLFVNDADKTARAQGSVSVRSFREEAAPTAAAAPARATAGSAPGPTIKVPVQVDADTLLHDDARKVTRFEGHAVYREPARRLAADTIVLEGGEGGTPATTRAEGHVVYEGEGKRGTGDRAVHRAADKTVTLEGRERPAQVVEAASGRSWRGPSLTWLQATDSIPVVTGTSGRSRIVGSTSSPPQDDVGKPADRGKPR